MALTKIQAHNIQDYAIDTAKLSNTATVAFAQTLAPKITTINITDSNYIILGNTTMNLNGGYIVITGSDFQSGAVVLVNNTQATSTTYVNSTSLRAQVPAKSAGSYMIFVINPDGGTSLKINGLTYQ